MTPPGVAFIAPAHPCADLDLTVVMFREMWFTGHFGVQMLIPGLVSFSAQIGLPASTFLRFVRLRGYGCLGVDWCVCVFYGP